MLLFFDIDGTLIGKPSYAMEESTRLAIAKAREGGHICVVNTGRTRTLVVPDITGLASFDGAIMGCGTMIEYAEEVLLHKTFSVRESLELIGGLQALGIDAVLEGSGNNYRDSYDRMFTERFMRYMKQVEDREYGTYREAPGCFDKFYAYVDQVSRMEAFRELFQDRLEFVDRHSGFFEIMPKGYSKAGAMRKLADYLGIPMEQTAAFGDSSNDLSMLECAHYAIAMGNAVEEVKEMADYVSTPVGQDGIWKGMKWLGVI